MSSHLILSYLIRLAKWAPFLKGPCCKVNTPHPCLRMPWAETRVWGFHLGTAVSSTHWTSRSTRVTQLYLMSTDRRLSSGLDHTTIIVSDMRRRYLILVIRPRNRRRINEERVFQQMTFTIYSHVTKHINNSQETAMDTDSHKTGKASCRWNLQTCIHKRNIKDEQLTEHEIFRNEYSGRSGICTINTYTP